MLKRPHYIALGLIVLVTLVILNLPAKTTARLKLGLGSLFLPLFGLANSVQQLGAGPAMPSCRASEIIREKENLRAQNQELRLQLMQAEGMVRENERLRQQLGWQPHKGWKLKPANVVLREAFQLVADSSNRSRQPRRRQDQLAGPDHRRTGRPYFFRQPNALPGGVAGRPQLQGRRAG